ncbi:MAG: Asp23/Gls24 family envelope stress response protein [Actinomycetaceae bacterium]|nr:Asp23/Gls24 family envelope stress response protein [Actinomycetaceae bacterium]
MANKNTPSTEKSLEKKPVHNVGEDRGRGQTTIYDAVVAKIAGLAIDEIPGVYSLGGAVSRAMGSVREAVGASKDITQGVEVEVGELQAAVDVKLIVEYPYPVHEVAEQVRDAVFAAIEGLVGLEVTEVNIEVTDVHFITDEERAKQLESKTAEAEEVRVK